MNMSNIHIAQHGVKGPENKVDLERIRYQYPKGSQNEPHDELRRVFLWNWASRR
jgi:hypothetical protein